MVESGVALIESGEIVRPHFAVSITHDVSLTLHLLMLVTFGLAWAVPLPPVINIDMFGAMANWVLNCSANFERGEFLSI